MFRATNDGSSVDVDIKHFHLFCGLGGGARGFNRGHARVGKLRAKFRCLGGVDSDPADIREFNRCAGVTGTVLDLFSREQYAAYHGHEAALDGLSDSAWRERIGNAVPPDAAAAIAGAMGTTLLLAKSGQTFTLSNQAIWVRPIATALSVQGPAP
jgi:site-specific DNA-cytosine methylase